MARTLDELSSSDVFDSREAQERIDELEAIDTDEEPLDADEVEELESLRALRDESGSEWSYGMTFIAEDYFEDYARELAEDIGAIQQDGEWPTNRIDWEAAADDLKMDYTWFEIAGRTYYAR